MATTSRSRRKRRPRSRRRNRRRREEEQVAEEQAAAQAQAEEEQVAEEQAAAQAQAQAEPAQAEEAEEEEEDVAPTEEEAVVEEEKEEEEPPEEVVSEDAELIAYIDGLSMGSCYNDAFDEDGEFDYSKPPLVVDCSERHDNEIYHYGVIGEALGNSPSDEALEEFALRRCGEGFLDFVGATPEESDLDSFVGFYPLAEDFAAGERRLVCGVYRDSFEPLIASAENRAIGFPARTLLAFEGIRDGVLNLFLYRQIPAGFFTDNATSALPFSNLAQPAWSWDGTILAFMVEAVLGDGTSQRDLYLLRGINTNVIQLTDGPGNNDSPAFSPDGRRIAFASDRSGDLEIYVMNTNGSNVVQLTNSPGNDTSPDWSPDGSQIAFRSNRDGEPDVYVMNADGSEPVNVSQNPGADDEFPSWGGSTVYAGSGIAVTVDDQDVVVLVLDAEFALLTRVPVTNGGADNPSQKGAWRLR